MKKRIWQIMISSVVCVVLLGGCSRSKPTGMPQVQANDHLATGEDLPAYIIRVQSSNGDIQQVEANVKEWLYNGKDQHQFEKRITPFDIPFGPGSFAVRIGSPGGGPELKVQLLKEGNKRAGFIQAREVCINGDGAGGFEVKGCGTGLR